MIALAACTTGGTSGENGTPGSTSPEPTKAPLPDPTLTLSVADGSVDVAPAGLVTVVAAGGTLDSVSLTTPSGAEIAGTIDPATATWTASETLQYDENYTLTASASNAEGKTAEAGSSFTTVSPSAQIFPGIGPLDGMLTGIAMPVRVYFDHPIADKKAIEQVLTVTPTPAQPGGWSWFGDKEVHWRPQEFWLPGTKVQVDVAIYGVHAGNGAWGKTSRTITFDIGAQKTAVCDTQTHQLHCYENGALVKSMPIAAGLEVEGRYTKNGIHVVTDKKAEMTMDSTTYGLALDAGGYQTEVQWATRISNNGEFVHSAPWSIADQGVRNVSHGCINASPENAKWYFNWCQIGDPLEVTGSPVPLTMADGDIFDWTIDWATWQQGSAFA